MVRSAWRRSLVALTIAALLALGAAPPSEAQPPPGSPTRTDGRAPLLGTDNADAIAGRYIVVLRKGTTANAAKATRQEATRHGARVDHSYTAALQGFAGTMPAKAVDALRANKHVAFVEADSTVRLVADQPSPPSWGLDRIDQRNLPLNANYLLRLHRSGCEGVHHRHRRRPRPQPVRWAHDERLRRHRRRRRRRLQRSRHPRRRHRRRPALRRRQGRVAGRRARPQLPGSGSNSGRSSPASTGSPADHSPGSRRSPT